MYKVSGMKRLPMILEGSLRTTCFRPCMLGLSLPIPMCRACRVPSTVSFRDWSAAKQGKAVQVLNQTRLRWFPPWRSIWEIVPPQLSVEYLEPPLVSAVVHFDEEGIHS